MIKRCTNQNTQNYKRYGGADPAVKVCERWQGEHGFENFLADKGPRPKGTTIGRFGDVGDYEPSNCAWMTDEEQVFHASKKAIVKPRKQANAKLAAQQVEEIRRALGEGRKPVDIAKKYGVSEATVRSIREGRIWSEKNPKVEFSPRKMAERGVGLTEIARTVLTLRGLLAPTTVTTRTGAVS